MRLVTGFFVVALVLPLALPAAGTDSLAEIAKKERERRKSKPSQPAKTYDDADLAKGSTSPADDASDEATPPGGESTTPADAPAPDGRLPDDEEGRKQLERLWRARFAEARANVQAADARAWRTKIDVVYKAGIPYQMEVREKVETEELKQARQALGSLEEEFRRTGFPAGWGRE